MIFLNETAVDGGRNAVAKIANGQMAIFYTRGRVAYKATVSLSGGSPSVTGKGRYAFCIQAAPLGERELRLYSGGITII